MSSLRETNQKQQLVQSLQKVPLFYRVEARYIQVLFKLGQARQVANGDFLWFEDDMPNGLYVLLRGTVELYVGGESLDRREAVQALGGEALLSGRPHREEVVCATPCLFLEVPTQNFLYFLEHNSSVAQRIYRNMVTDLSVQLKNANDEVGVLGENCRELEEKIDEAEHHANDLNMVRSLRGR